MERRLLRLKSCLALLVTLFCFLHTSKGFSRSSSEDVWFMNFVEETFSYLNITSISSVRVEDSDECGFACVETLSCFSYNLEATSNSVDGKRLCELLPSDKCNNSDKFNFSQRFNHHSIQGDTCPTEKDEVPGTFRPSSCLDYLLRGDSTCGMYRIYDDAGNNFPAYCDFKSEPGTAWTLVMSWAYKNRSLPALWRTPFKNNAPVNENAHNWNLYRLSLTRMRSLQSRSTHWRATCSFPTYGVDFTDYVRGNFKDFNIVDFIGSGQCKKVEYVNIRGHIGIHLTARFWQSTSYMLHIDSSYSGCNFDPRSGSVSSEDNFGGYYTINSKFRCTEGDLSTTQWWFGAHL